MADIEALDIVSTLSTSINKSMVDLTTIYHNHWQIANFHRYSVLFVKLQESIATIKSNILLGNNVNVWHILFATSAAHKLNVLLKQLLEFYVPRHTMYKGYRGSEEQKVIETLQQISTGKSSVFPLHTNVSQLRLLVQEINILNSHTDRIRQRLLEQESSITLKKSPRESIIWAGSIHDSDTSTLRLDTSSTWSWDLEDQRSTRWPSVLFISRFRFGRRWVTGG